MIRALVEQTFDATKKYFVLAGLSTDSKPTTGLITGSKFLEVDTGVNYVFDEVSGTWSASTITEQEIKDEIDSWLEDNIDPDSGYALDRTLSLSNAAAPADMVGDLKSALNYLEDDIYDYNNSIGFIIGNISDTDGKAYNSTKYARTSNFVYAKKGSAIYTDDPQTFKYNVVAYTSADASTWDSDSVHKTTDDGIFFMPFDGYIRSSIAYRDLRELSDTSISAHLIMKIINKIKANEQISILATKEQNDADFVNNRVDVLNDTLYTKATNLSYTIGALGGDGGIDSSTTTRVRLATKLYVKKGSTISVDSSSYKFNAATYSGNTSKTEMIDYYSPRTGDNPITVQQDCYVMFAIGTVNDDVQSDTSISSHFKINLLVEEKSKAYTDQSVNELKTSTDKITYVNDYAHNDIRFAIGFITGTGGKDDSRLYWARFDEYIPVRKGSILKIDSDDYSFNVAEYSYPAVAGLIVHSGTISSSREYVVQNDCYIRSSIRIKNDTTALTNLLITNHYDFSELRRIGSNQIANEYDIYSFPQINDERIEIPVAYSDFDAMNDSMTYTDLISYIDDAIADANAADATIDASYPYAKKIYMGKDASDTFDIYQYKLCTPPWAGVGYDFIEKMKKKPTIVVVAGQHGDERGSQIACAHMIDLLTNHWQDDDGLFWLHWNINLIVIPCLNPYGCTYSTYKNSQGINLNRDWDYNFIPNTDPEPGDENAKTGPVPFSTAETVLLRNFLVANDVVHVVDFHTNNSTKGNPSLTNTNWISLPSENELYNKDIFEAVKNHCVKIGAQFNKEYSFGQPGCKKFYYISYSTSNNMLKSYAYNKLHIPSTTLECCAKEPGDADLYTERMNKMNTETIINWLYNICLQFAT